MEIDKEEYKGYTIKVHYNKERRYGNKAFYATCEGIGITFEKPSIEEAVNGVKKKIDTFIATAPATWEELAEELTNYLVWTSYEECHVDPKILKQLTKSYLITQTKENDE